MTLTLLLLWSLCYTYASGEEFCIFGVKNGAPDGGCRIDNGPAAAIIITIGFLLLCVGFVVIMASRAVEGPPVIGDQFEWCGPLLCRCIRCIFCSLCSLCGMCLRCCCDKMKSNDDKQNQENPQKYNSQGG